MFNTDCPGWDSYGSSDGFIPCDEDTGCAKQYEEKVEQVVSTSFPLKSKGRYDRFAIGPEASIWVCADCGMVCDPDTHDEECHVSEQFHVSNDDEDNDMEDSFRTTINHLDFYV
jgi:rubrerythrin